MSNTSFVQLDSRKRANLSSVATANLYTVTAERSGRIILEPASVVSNIEQDFRSNPDAIAAVAAYRANPEDLVDDE